MATKETNLMNAMMVALSEAGCLVFRNNTGVLPGPNGRPIKFGLCNGGSDLIGICADGRFLGIEVKPPVGRVSPAQTAFIAAVRRHGGRAGVARSVEDALAIAFPPPG